MSKIKKKDLLRRIEELENKNQKSLEEDFSPPKESTKDHSFKVGDMFFLGSDHLNPDLCKGTALKIRDIDQGSVYFYGSWRGKIIGSEVYLGGIDKPLVQIITKYIDGK